jgi:hypothetical protein
MAGSNAAMNRLPVFHSEGRGHSEWFYLLPAPSRALGRSRSFFRQWRVGRNPRSFDRGLDIQAIHPRRRLQDWLLDCHRVLHSPGLRGIRRRTRASVRRQEHTTTRHCTASGRDSPRRVRSRQELEGERWNSSCYDALIVAVPKLPARRFTIDVLSATGTLLAPACRRRAGCWFHPPKDRGAVARSFPVRQRHPRGA